MDKARKSAAKKLLKQPRGKFKQIDLQKNPHPNPNVTRAFINKRYVVSIEDDVPMSGNINAILALIQRHDDKPIHNHWKELQLIKNELFGCDVTAIEYYPPQHELVDEYNIYWLWVLPEGSLPYPVKRGSL